MPFVVLMLSPCWVPSVRPIFLEAISCMGPLSHTSTDYQSGWHGELQVGDLTGYYPNNVESTGVRSRIVNLRRVQSRLRPRTCLRQRSARTSPERHP